MLQLSAMMGWSGFRPSELTSCGWNYYYHDQGSKRQNNRTRVDYPKKPAINYMSSWCWKRIKESNIARPGQVLKSHGLSSTWAGMEQQQVTGLTRVPTKCAAKGGLLSRSCRVERLPGQSWTIRP